MGLPVVPPEDALEAVKALVKVDERFVPSEPGTSLYIRPFLFGTDAKLGLHGVHEAMFIVVLSPVGSYFDNGMEPVKIIVETEDVRAGPGRHRRGQVRRQLWRVQPRPASGPLPTAILRFCGWTVWSISTWKRVAA